jgi:hypothetical protein
MAFAQFDDDESSDASDESSYSADEESDDSVGSATASGDQWEGFKYEEMGLTQWEFQQAKEEGISREKLTHLVELGVRLSEYLQRPWEKLGVSEDQWLDERSAGMEDADIDRSYRNRSGDQAYAYVSLFLPSFYQWKTDKTMKAIWMDALWVTSVGVTAYLYVDGSSAWWYGLLGVAAAHIWSFADAFFGTQWDSNPDANRFSFGILPTPEKGVLGAFQVKF